MGLGLLLLALLLLLLAAALATLSRRRRQAAGLPHGRVVYVDSRDWEQLNEPLRAPRYGLVGRPDYLLQEGRAIIPVEAKPSRQAEEPYEADLLQLAAYCLLVEESYRAAPPHGLLVYAGRAFEVPYNRTVRGLLLQVLEEMQRAGPRDDVPRSHDQPVRCRACSMRRHCGQEALA